MRDLRSIYTDLHDLLTDGIAYNAKYVKERTIESDYVAMRNKSASNHWTQFKSAFNYYTKNRCPVCERHVGKYDDIEHYRPKEYYWWLAYDFYNYYNCCDLCNRFYKLTAFPLFDETKKVDFLNRTNISNEQPLIFNPLKDNPLDLFQLEFVFTSATGCYPMLRITANANLDETSYEYAKAVKTIELFNLNGENPKNDYHDAARLDTAQEFATTLWDFKERLDQWSKEHDQAVKAQKLERIKEFKAKNGLFLLEFVIKGCYTVLPPVTTLSDQ